MFIKNKKVKGSTKSDDISSVSSSFVSKNGEVIEGESNAKLIFDLKLSQLQSNTE